MMGCVVYGSNEAKWAGGDGYVPIIYCTFLCQKVTQGWLALLEHQIYR